MAADDDNRMVTIEVEMADSESPEGVFQSVVHVRISSPDKQACEMVREAVQLAIQVALDERDETDAHEPRH